MNRTLLVGIAIFVIVVVFIVLLALSRAAQNARRETVTAVEKEIIAAIDVIQDPLVYDGLTFEVEAPISDWVTKKSFTLSAGGGGGLLGGGEEQLLVITKSPLPLPKDAKNSQVGLGETVNVRVKGRARIMDRVELGRALGLDLEGTDIQLDDNEKIADWTEGSVILAESVEKL